MNSKVRFLTNTAMMLAAVIVVQMLGRLIPAPFNQYIVGTLVNAALLIATAFAGIWSGLVVAVVSPFTSLINNHAPVAAALLPFAPFIAAGNFVLVLSYWIFRRKLKPVGIAVGAVLKFGFLYGAILGFFAVAGNMGLTAITKFEKVLTAMFGLPQLFTALLGGAIAFAAIRLMKRQLPEV